MNPDDKTAWLHEHMVQKRIETEIDRIFQRLNYFMVASAFLLTAFATTAIDPAEGLRIDGPRGGIAWLVIVTGLLLSLLFWVMNSWNSHFTYEFSEWAKDHGPCQERAIGGLPTTLGQDIRDIQKVVDGYVNLNAKRLLVALVDIFDPSRPAWFARFIPLTFVGVWCGIGAICWPETSGVTWMIIGLPVALALVVGLFALVDP